MNLKNGNLYSTLKLYIQTLTKYFFFCGFRNYNESNPNINWMENAWDPEKANKDFQKKLDKGEIKL